MHSNRTISSLAARLLTLMLLGLLSIGASAAGPTETSSVGHRGHSVPMEITVRQDTVAATSYSSHAPAVSVLAGVPLRVYQMSWAGAADFRMVARFAFNPATAPAVINAVGLGTNNGLEFLEIVFINPAGALLQQVINVENGVSSYGFLNFTFDTTTESLAGFIDIGKDDGLPGDWFLSGDSLGVVSLVEVGGGTFDSGGPIVVTLVTDPLELNDSFAAATPIGCDQFFFNQPTIEPLGDLDVYRLNAPPGVKARINLDADAFGSTLDTLLGVFDSSGALLALSDDDPAPFETLTLDSYIDIAMPGDGELLIVVTSFRDLDFDGWPGDPPTRTGNYVISVDCGFVPGRLYGSTGVDDTLIEIDPASGAAAPLAAIGNFGRVSDLEFRPDGVLFGSTGGGTQAIVTISPANYSESLYCTHIAGALNGLEFVNGALYATYISAPGALSQLVIVEPPTAPGAACALTFIGNTGVGGIGGLAYDPSNATMYGCTVGGNGAIGPPGQLITIDLATGAASPVGAANIGADACSALEFTSPAAGTESFSKLYAGIGTADAAFPGYLFEVFPNFGSGIAVGPTGFSGVSGLAFAPGQLVDTDNDGVPDTDDNCTRIPNPDQRDSNNDGFGNICDADTNNDCVVNVIDLGLLRANFFAQGDLDTDFNGDGVTNVVDLGILRKFFFDEVGPSANVCGIENPSFETGDFSGWNAVDHSAPFFPLAVDGPGLSPGFGFFSSDPTDGGLAALTGFDGGGAETISIGQDVFVVPATPFLRADYRVAWNLVDFCTGCLDRTFRLNIYAPGGAFLIDSRVVDVLPGGTTLLDSGDRLMNVDLSAFAGTPVFINFEFEVPEPSTGPAFLQLDNVRFE